jgi:hypothetical protein
MKTRRIHEHARRVRPADNSPKIAADLKKQKNVHCGAGFM